MLSFGSEQKQEVMCFPLRFTALAGPGGDCPCHLFHQTAAVGLVCFRTRLQKHVSPRSPHLGVWAQPAPCGWLGDGDHAWLGEVEMSGL